MKKKNIISRFRGARAYMLAVAALAGLLCMNQPAQAQSTACPTSLNAKITINDPTDTGSLDTTLKFFAANGTLRSNGKLTVLQCDFRQTGNVIINGNRNVSAGCGPAQMNVQLKGEFVQDVGAGPAVIGTRVAGTTSANNKCRYQLASFRAVLVKEIKQAAPPAQPQPAQGTQCFGGNGKKLICDFSQFKKQSGSLSSCNNNCKANDTCCKPYCNYVYTSSNCVKVYK